MRKARKEIYMFFFVFHDYFPNQQSYFYLLVISLAFFKKKQEKTIERDWLIPSLNYYSLFNVCSLVVELDQARHLARQLALDRYRKEKLDLGLRAGRQGGRSKRERQGAHPQIFGPQTCNDGHMAS